MDSCLVSQNNECWALVETSHDPTPKPFGSCLHFPMFQIATAGICLNFTTLKTENVGQLFGLRKTQNQSRWAVMLTSQDSRQKPLGSSLNYSSPNVLGNCLNFPRARAFSSWLNYPRLKTETVGQLFELPCLKTETVGQ